MENRYKCSKCRDTGFIQTESGVRNLKYVKGILKNWKTKGFKSEKVVKGNGSSSKSTKNTESEKPKYNFDSLYGK